MSASKKLHRICDYKTYFVKQPVFNLFIILEYSEHLADKSLRIGYYYRNNSVLEWAH